MEELFAQLLRRWTLLHLGQLHEETAVACLDGGKLTVPGFDESLLVFDLAQFEELRSE
jgi:hypothetical protein